MKKNIVVPLLASMLVTSSVPVFAAPVTMPDGTVFDPEYYAAANPDVVAVFGTDINALYYHYSLCGRVEGRPATAEEAAVKATISVQNTADIKAKILSLQTTYPEGLHWTNEDNHYYSPAWHLIGHGCVSFAMTVSDYVYGAGATVNRFYDPDPDIIQVGDAVKYQTGSGTHWVIVTDESDTAITVCEGNYNKSIHWGRVIKKSTLQGKIVYVARRG